MAAGNMTNSGSGVLTYDAENRLTIAAGVTYVYDGDGKRVKKSTGKLYWTGTGSEPLAETDLAGVIQSEFTFFGGKRVARRDGSGNSVFYYFSDHLGSASVVTNATGIILDESDYYPFGGERVIINSDPNPYKFTGKERDAESGLDYFGARYYGSNLGRFLQADQPFADQDPTDPQSWNLYTYTRNNPLRHVDPDGQGVWDLFKGAVIGAANFVKNTARNIANPANLSPISMLSPRAGVSAGLDYSQGVVGDRLAAQGEQGAMEVVTEAVITGGAAASIRVTSLLPVKATPAPAAPAPAPAPAPATPEVPMSIPAGPSPHPTAAQQAAINEMGNAHGCHTCGASSPETKSGNWIGDHQPSTALNPPGGPQVYKPQCLQCSRQQGGQVAAAVRAEKKKVEEPK